MRFQPRFIRVIWPLLLLCGCHYLYLLWNCEHPAKVVEPLEIKQKPLDTKACENQYTRKICNCADLGYSPEFIQGKNPDWHKYRMSATAIGPLDSNSVILDIGGNIGRDMLEFTVYGPKEIHVFEPIPDLIKVLDETILSKQITNAHVHKYGLGRETRYADILIGRDPINEAAAVLTKEKAEQGATLRIKIVDVLEALDDLNLQHIDLLHMNCEGCEYEVIPRLLCSPHATKIKRLNFATHRATSNTSCQMFDLLSRHFDSTYCFNVWQGWKSKYA